MPSSQEYLLSYGALGDFGRFHPVTALACRRGHRAVVRSHRGVELATVLGEARPGHAAFLPNTTVGQLLRLATAEDEDTARRRRAQAQGLFDDACRLAGDLGLPVEVIDVEVLLDGAHAVLHHLRGADFDPRPFVSALSHKHEVHLTLQDLTRPAGGHEEEPEHGCGRPDCGSAAGGGCGSSGACSTCGLKQAVDLKAYFAGLRAQMETRGGPLPTSRHP
jgi:hypothetical protein